MRYGLIRYCVNKVDPINIPNTKRVAFMTGNVLPLNLPSLDRFVSRFFLVMYWNTKRPLESVVELRFSRYGEKDNHPIDPSLLRKVLSDMPRYRDAIVELSPGRTFFKGLCGDYAANLDSYAGRTGDSLAGALVFNECKPLAIALSFPGKIKSMHQANEVNRHIWTIDLFVVEMNGFGAISHRMEDYRKLIDMEKSRIDELDIYISEDHKSFEAGVETLRKYGIEYSFSLED